jgi:O-antigen ligase
MRQITYWLIVLTVLVLVGMYIRRDAGGSTVGKLVAVPAILSWLLYKLESRRFRAFGPMMVWLFAFMVYSCVSIFWTVDVDGTTFAIQRFASIAAIVFLIWDMGLTQKEAQGLLQAYVFSFYIAFVLVLRNASTGAELDDRASSAGVDPNILGGLAVYGMPVAWYLGTVKQGVNWLMKLMNLCFPLVAALIIILGASRGALLLALPGFIYVLATLRRAPSWVLPLVLAGVAVIIPLGVYGPLQTKFQRLGTALQSITHDGGNGRFDTWNSSIQAFSKAPILGNGANTAAATSLKYPGDHVAGNGRNTHSLYFQVLGDLGLVGICLLAAILVCLYQLTRHLPKESRLAAQLSLLTFVLVNSQVPTYTAMPNYIFLAVFACWLTANAEPRGLKANARPVVIPGKYPSVADA